MFDHTSRRVDGRPVGDGDYAVVIEVSVIVLIAISGDTYQNFR
jgi:hypothetical protein